MESKFTVYDIINDITSLVNGSELINMFKGLDLSIFNLDSISVVNIYSKGERQFMISRVKEMK